MKFEEREASAGAFNHVSRQEAPLVELLEASVLVRGPLASLAKGR